MAPSLGRTSSVLHRYAGLASALHLQHVGPVLERLRKVADVARYILVAVNGEREDGLLLS